MRVFLALRVFFKVLFDGGFAGQVDAVARGAAPALEPPAPPAAKPQRRPQRSEALTLLAALERESRLVDFLQESIDGYSDAQIGAAVRDVHRDAAAAVERMFALRPVVDGQEGSTVEVPAGFAGHYKLVGNVTGEPPFHGQLVHHGWLATTCSLPSWSGDETTAFVVAPAEVELK
jgi:hypothetical protein